MRHISPVKVAGDLVLFALLIALAVVFKTTVVPSHIGFFCNDVTIHHPYHDSTVPAPVLHVLTLIIPLIFICVIEACSYFLWEKNAYTDSFALGRFKVHRLIVRLYYFIGYFLVGALFNRILCDIAKYTVGQLRPNFISICQPDKDFSNCTEAGYFITNYRCSNRNKKKVQDARLSFCSGHTAYSFYTATYLYFYIRTRLKRRFSSSIFVPVVQFLIYSLAIYIAFTRLKDYKHFLSNVYFGAGLGFIVGIVQAVQFAELKLFSEKFSKKVDEATVLYQRKKENSTESSSLTEAKKPKKSKPSDGKVSTTDGKVSTSDVITVEDSNNWKTLVY